MNTVNDPSVMPNQQFAPGGPANPFPLNGGDLADAQAARRASLEQQAVEKSAAGHDQGRMDLTFHRPGLRAVPTMFGSVESDHPGHLNVSVSEAICQDKGYLTQLAREEAARLLQTDRDVEALVGRLVKDLPEAKALVKATNQAAATQAELAKMTSERDGHLKKADLALDAGQDPATHELAAKLAGRRLAKSQAAVDQAAQELTAARRAYQAAFLTAYRAAVTDLIVKAVDRRRSLTTELVRALAKAAVAVEAEAEAAKRLDTALRAYDPKPAPGPATGQAVPGQPIPEPTVK
jgi:hypothetical protein